MTARLPTLTLLHLTGDAFDILVLPPLHHMLPHSSSDTMTAMDVTRVGMSLAAIRAIQVHSHALRTAPKLLSMRHAQLHYQVAGVSTAAVVGTILAPTTMTVDLKGGAGVMAQ